MPVKLVPILRQMRFAELKKKKKKERNKRKEALPSRCLENKLREQLLDSRSLVAYSTGQSELVMEDPWTLNTSLAVPLWLLFSEGGTSCSDVGPIRIVCLQAASQSPLREQKKKRRYFWPNKSFIQSRVRAVLDILSVQRWSGSKYVPVITSGCLQKTSVL